MNLNELKYFVCTVQYGSFTGAAKNLYMTPPAISRAVGELEKSLKIKLVTREGRKVVPTEYGMVLYEKAKEVLNEAAELELLGQSLAQYGKFDNKISLALATTPNRGSLTPPSIIDAASTIYPFHNVDLYFRSNAGCFAALDNGLVDCAIVLGEAAISATTSTKLLSLSPMAAMSKRNPLSNEPFIRIRDLGNYPVARPYDLKAFYVEINLLFKSRRITPSFVELEPTNKSHARFLEDDLGIVFVTQHFNPAEYSTNTVTVPIAPDDSISIPVQFCYANNENAFSSSTLRESVQRALKMDAKVNSIQKRKAQSSHSLR